MDGNGRWAAREGVSRARGHEAGADAVRAVIEGCRELGAVESLSLYAFSTENWRRSDLEINTLFRLLSKFIASDIDELHEQNVRVRVGGRRAGLPARARADIERAIAKTAGNTAMTVNIAINYGGRAEIVDACRQLIGEVQAGTLDPDTIDEDSLSERLYVPETRDLDLLIRTAGEYRLSNFMLWEASYAEFVTVDTLWPDFRKPHLVDAFAEFQRRNRSFGGRKDTA
jgi:undecaprenyl diphosphate synthase